MLFRSEAQSYRVKVVAGLPVGQPVEGLLAVAAGSRPEDLLDAVEGLDESVRELGAIAVLPNEYFYSPVEATILSQIIDKGVPIKGILTFGSIVGSSHQGVSHLSVTALDLGIPFVLAKKPWLERGYEQQGSWEGDNKLLPLHGQLGRVTVLRSLRSGQRVRVEPVRRTPLHRE